MGQNELATTMRGKHGRLAIQGVESSWLLPDGHCGYRRMEVTGTENHACLQQELPWMSVHSGKQYAWVDFYSFPEIYGEPAGGGLYLALKHFVDCVSLVASRCRRRARQERHWKCAWRRIIQPALAGRCSYPLGTPPWSKYVRHDPVAGCVRPGRMGRRMREVDRLVGPKTAVAVAFVIGPRSSVDKQIENVGVT